MGLGHHCKRHFSLTASVGFWMLGCNGNVPGAPQWGYITIQWPQFFTIIYKNEKMPTFAICKCFQRGRERYKRMGVNWKKNAAHFSNSDYSVWVLLTARDLLPHLVTKNRPRNDGVAIAALQLGSCSLQIACANMVLWKNSSVPLLPFKHFLFSFRPICVLLQSAAGRPCASCFAFGLLNLALGSSISCFQTIFCANLINSGCINLVKDWSQMLFCLVL